jgi:hypothetical protein
MNLKIKKYNKKLRAPQKREKAIVDHKPYWGGSIRTYTLNYLEFFCFYGQGALWNIKVEAAWERGIKRSPGGLRCF